MKYILERKQSGTTAT